MAIDPVCGEALRQETALVEEIRNEIRFFCGEECAARFANAPWRYEDEEWVDRQPQDAG